MRDRGIRWERSVEARSCKETLVGEEGVWDFSTVNEEAGGAYGGDT